MCAAPAPSIVTLLTDFGSRDGYAGVVKGVLLRGVPDAGIVDISHEVPPQDIRTAAYLLASSYRYFPPRTVHVVIVDPGVGTTRRIVAADAGNHRFLGPDNGALWPALESAGHATVVAASREAILRAQRDALPAGFRESSTFNGRDRFAPLACLLARGASLDDLGDRIDDPVELPLGAPRRETDGSLVGEVLHVDTFGNLVTNITPEELGTLDVSFSIGGRAVCGVSETYASRPSGELVALVGSSGRIEISKRDGSAARELGVCAGAVVAAAALDDEDLP